MLFEPNVYLPSSQLSSELGVTKIIQHSPGVAQHGQDKVSWLMAIDLRLKTVKKRNITKKSHTWLPPYVRSKLQKHRRHQYPRNQKV